MKLLVLLLFLLVPACASVERNGHDLKFRLSDDPKRPAPACTLEIDGELLHSGSIDECPAVPVCEAP